MDFTATKCILFHFLLVSGPQPGGAQAFTNPVLRSGSLPGKAGEEPNGVLILFSFWATPGGLLEPYGRLGSNPQVLS